MMRITIRKNARNNTLDAYLDAKAAHHAKYIKKHPEKKKFEQGWKNRISDIKKNAAEIREIKKAEFKEEFLKTFPTKYSGDNAIEKMNEKEFKSNEKNINKELDTRFKMLEEYNKKIKKLGGFSASSASLASSIKGVSTSYAAAESNTKDKLANNSTPAHNPIYSYINNPKKSSELINFDGISHDGIPFKNWSEKNQRAFLEGVFGESLEEVDKKAREKRNSNNKKGNWTDMSWIFLAVQIFRSASTVLPFPLHKIFTLACLRSA